MARMRRIHSSGNDYQKMQGNWKGVEPSIASSQSIRNAALRWGFQKGMVEAWELILLIHVETGNLLNLENAQDV
jgi:hypothetical protein